MKFEEYCAPYSVKFGDDFYTELQRRLGDNAGEFSRLQDCFGMYPHLCSREEQLRNIRKFYRIVATAGIKDLITTTYPHSAWIAEEISGALKGGQNICDIGCGDGFFTIFCAINNPNASFTAIDLSKDALEDAERKATGRGVTNIRWVHGDIMDSHAQGEMAHANIVILQDVLYQLFGAERPQKEEEALCLLYPHLSNGSRVIVAQEGYRPKKETQCTTNKFYSLESHRQETMFDKNSGCTTIYTVAIFRKRTVQGKQTSGFGRDKAASGLA